MAESTVPQSEPVNSETAPSLSEKGAAEPVVSDFEGAEEHGADAQPHLHAKTFLAVLAVFLIYAAQLFAIVGAGTVSTMTFRSCVIEKFTDSSLSTARDNDFSSFRTIWRCCVGRRKSQLQLKAYTQQSMHMICVCRT